MTAKAQARPGVRRAFLVLALIATIAVSIWAGSIETDGELSVDARPVRSAPELLASLPARQSGRPESDALSDAFADGEPWKLPERPGAQQKSRNPFVPVAPPPPPPRKVAPAEVVVQAPPLPFTAIGRMTVEGQPSILLSHGPQTHVVAVGTQVGDFRLDSVEGNAFVFVHVPTGLTQTLQAAR